MTRALSALVALTLLIVPCAATAQTNAPPGNSAIDEYLETVPGATGNRTPGKPGTGEAALTAAERARLERLGPDGKALADAVDATATSTAGAKSNESSPASAPTGEGRSPLSEVIAAAAGRDDGGGMGVLLPAILLATLLGVIALAVMRRRSVS